MPPKITIIIPVYNVEQYLRECLDSVVNQTMREIQIICVNDGSPDGSRAILQKYADRDARMEIIDKPNGGLSSARNAAYPFIRGKYTMFVDSDDWIELDCCEKALHKAEQTGAEVTLFFFVREGCIDDAPWMPHHWMRVEDKTTIQEKLPLVDYCSACERLWLSDFLLDNNLTFPEGLVYEDILVGWKSVFLAKRFSVVPERLYHYRYNPNSIMCSNKNCSDIVVIFNRILEFLQESGHYQSCQGLFITTKLKLWHYFYFRVTPDNRPHFLELIRESMTPEDWEFCRRKTKKGFSNSSSHLLGPCMQDFYLVHVDGRWFVKLKYHFLEFVKWPERLLRRGVVKPLKSLLGIKKQFQIQ